MITAAFSYLCINYCLNRSRWVWEIWISANTNSLLCIFLFHSTKQQTPETGSQSLMVWSFANYKSPPDLLDQNGLTSGEWRCQHFRQRCKNVPRKYLFIKKHCHIYPQLLTSVLHSLKSLWDFWLQCKKKNNLFDQKPVDYLSAEESDETRCNVSWSCGGRVTQATTWRILQLDHTDEMIHIWHQAKKLHNLSRIGRLCLLYWALLLFIQSGRTRLDGQQGFDRGYEYWSDHISDRHCWLLKAWGTWR